MHLVLKYPVFICGVGDWAAIFMQVVMRIRHSFTKGVARAKEVPLLIIYLWFKSRLGWFASRCAFLLTLLIMHYPTMWKKTQYSLYSSAVSSNTDPICPYRNKGINRITLKFVLIISTNRITHAS